MRCLTSLASTTCGGSARTPARTATASSIATSDSQSSPQAPAASTSPSCSASGPTTSVLLSNGLHGLETDQLERLQALGIPINETPVTAVESDDGGNLRLLRLGDGETLDRDALFFYVGWQLRNDVARKLGCQLRDDGSIAVDAGQATTVDRVYAAGNCADPRALVPAAAGSGATAAVAINAHLSVVDADHAVINMRASASAADVR